MKIEIRKNAKPGVAQPWSWRLVSKNGKIVGNGERHPSKANAMRAAKGVVTEICKLHIGDAYTTPAFSKPTEINGIITITWS